MGFKFLVKKRYVTLEWPPRQESDDDGAWRCRGKEGGEDQSGGGWIA